MCKFIYKIQAAEAAVAVTQQLFLESHSAVFEKGRHGASRLDPTLLRQSSSSFANSNCFLHSEGVLLWRFSQNFHGWIPRSAGSHDNVVAMRGISLKEQSLVLVMEYCPKGTLGLLLHGTANRSTELDVFKIVAWVRAIARGMLHLHTRSPPILHRDLKPANIFVGKLSNGATPAQLW